MFNRGKKPEPEPETKPDSKAEDIKQIKAWITEIAEPKFKFLEDREQKNRDGVTAANDRCADNNSDTRKLWQEKDKEHESLVKEISRLNRENRDLRTELAGKANRAKPSKPAKA